MDFQIDRIAQAFKDQILLITGGTGFVGKAFIERLLRTTEVKKIFIIVRRKKSIEPQKRLEIVLNDQLFDEVKTRMTHKEILNVIKVIEGDCEMKDLNLNLADRQLITENVTMIFNFAATVRFTEKFKHAITLNVRNVREMLKLANDCKNLALFCHLSTAFCHLDVKVLMEQFYPPPMDPHTAIAIVDEIYDEEAIEGIFSKFISKKIPNSYSFTKSLAETLVVEASEEFGLPVMICRPVALIPAYLEPLPGWTDNFNTSTGVTTSTALGILRSIFYYKKSCLNVQPVDQTIHNIMMCTWDYLYQFKNDKKLSIINLEYQQSVVKDFISNQLSIFRTEYPPEVTFGYPNVEFTNYKLLHFVRTLFYQWIPAIIIDILLILARKKPILLKIQGKIYKSLTSMEFFMNSEYIFDTKKLNEIKSKLNEFEQSKYSTTPADEDLFMKNHALGVRRYLLKQSDASISKAQKMIKFYFYLNWILKLSTTGMLLLFFLYKKKMFFFNNKN